MDEKPIKLFEDTTARQLFEEANKDHINEEASRVRVAMNGSNHAGHYQMVLKEMWEGLDVAEQERYNKEAGVLNGDIFRPVSSFLLITFL